MSAPAIPQQTEAQFTSAVIQLAQTLGYLCHHCRPARTQSGRWATPIQGDAGFPDLVLVHRDTGRIVFAELKAARGRVSDGQQLWLDALYESAAAARIWYPAHWDALVAELQEGAGR